MLDTQLGEAFEKLGVVVGTYDNFPVRLAHDV